MLEIEAMSTFIESSLPKWEIKLKSDAERKIHNFLLYHPIAHWHFHKYGEIFNVFDVFYKDIALIRQNNLSQSQQTSNVDV